MREAYTAVTVRGETWAGEVETEPYEAAWAGQCVAFVRALATTGRVDGGTVAVEISPDGIHWVAEGTTFPLPSEAEAITFARVANFGHFLRLKASVPEGASCTVMVSLALKE